VTKGDVPSKRDKVHRGYVTRYEETPEGKWAGLVPWYEADTIGPTGLQPSGVQDIPEEGEVRIRRRKRPPVPFDVKPVPKRTPRDRAMSLTLKLVAMVEDTRRRLGRPVVAGDLSDQMLQAIQAETWKAGDPVTPAHLRRVAQTYLDEAERKARSA
jgi:hypothetical protein